MANVGLLAQNDNLQVHEEKSKGVYVKNLSDYYVSSAREVYEIMRQGGAARVVSSTSKYDNVPRVWPGCLPSFCQT